MKKTAGFLIAIMLGMTFAPNVFAASKVALDADADATLTKFYESVSGGKNLVKDAKGVLIFPSVIKAGMLVGGEYGEGALRVDGKTVDYYSTAAASLGFQLGAQKKSIIVLFMQPEALDKFRASEGWKAGVDASIAVVAVGAGGDLDSSKLNQPILGFILDQKGLMYNLTLEGAKFTKLNKD